MPLGDPMGGDQEAEDRGSVGGLWMFALPVSDLDEAIYFYNEILGLPIALDARENNWVELGDESREGLIALYVPLARHPRKPGGPSGLVLRSKGIYDTHQRLVDHGVEFIMKPERQAWGGVLAIFKDQDENEIMIMEDPEHYSRAIDMRGVDIGATCFLPLE